MLKSKDQNNHCKLRTKRINPLKNKKIKDKIRKINFNPQKTKKETLKQIILNRLNHNEKSKLNEKQNKTEIKNNVIIEFILLVHHFCLLFFLGEQMKNPAKINFIYTLYLTCIYSFHPKGYEYTASMFFIMYFKSTQSN